MEKRSLLGKILRFAAILLLGLTAIFHLLGGAGTSCVAFFAEKWDSMAAIVPYKWLYIVFVLVTLVIGVIAIRATIRLARGKAGSYRNALNILIVALIVSGAHMAASEILRGSSAPTSMRVYLNALTLLIFLLLRIPGIFEKIAFESIPPGNERGAAAGGAMILMGITTLTVHLWAGGTHTWGDGVNYADVWHAPLTAAGWLLVAAGCVTALLPWVVGALKSPAAPALAAKK